MVALAHRDKVGDAQDGIRCEMVQPTPIEEEKAEKLLVRDALVPGQCRDDLVSRHPPS